MTLLVVGGALTAGGYVSARPVLFVTGAAFVAPVLGAVGALALATVPLPQFAGTTHAVPRGSDLTLDIELTHRGGRRSAAGELDPCGHAELLPRAMPSVGRGPSALVRFPAPTRRRGEFTIGPIRMRVVTPLGIAARSYVERTTATLIVTPRTHALRLPAARKAFPDAPKGKVDSRSTGSDDFRRVRPYVRGDDSRRIDWKATARTGDVLVREYTNPTRDDMCVVLDDHSTMPAERFEEAVDVTASLVAACHRAGRRVTLVTSSARVGHGDEERLLTHIQQRRSATRLRGREFTLALPRRSGEVVVVTGAVDAAVATAVGVLGARFPDVTLLDLTGEAPAVPVHGVRTLRAESATQVVKLWNAQRR